MAALARKNCVPCKEGAPRLSGAEIQELSAQIKGWEIIRNHHLRRAFKFKDFMTALAFVNRVGDVAEAQGHHPNICFTWGKVELEIWTHAIDGLHENDFILAAKVDELAASAEGLKPRPRPPA